MDVKDSKIISLVKNLNEFDETTIGRKYWLNQRCLILIGHLFVEHFIDEILINIGFSKKYVSKNNFSSKLDKVHEKEIIDAELCEKIHSLNKVRNIIGHELKIVGKISTENPKYLDMKSTKLEIMDIICRVSNANEMVIAKKIKVIPRIF